MSELRVPVTDRDHSLGPQDAPVTLVEYGDFQCPYCGAAYPVVKQVLEQFEGDVRFVFRNFPLTEVHPEALDAAQVAELASTHRQFWAAHDLLFEHQDELGYNLYLDICRRLRIDAQSLQEVLDDGRYVDAIRAEEEGGIRSGVNGTPTFFLNGLSVDGGAPDLVAAIERALADDALPRRIS